jgi:hypothetical protein
VEDDERRAAAPGAWGVGVPGQPYARRVGTGPASDVDGVARGGGLVGQDGVRVAGVGGGPVVGVDEAEERPAEEVGFAVSE